MSASSHINVTSPPFALLRQVPRECSSPDTIVTAQRPSRRRRNSTRSMDRIHDSKAAATNNEIVSPLL